jgi:hypothetical protein
VTVLVQGSNHPLTQGCRVNRGNLAQGTNWRTLFLTSPEKQSHPSFKLIDSDLGQVNKLKGEDVITVLKRLKTGCVNLYSAPNKL